MGKKLLFVITGPRLGGSTAFVTRTAAEAAREAGNDVTVVEFPKLKGHATGCLGCYSCQHSIEYKCVLDDEVTNLVASVPKYDTVIISGPVYFFSMSSQAKAFLDRFFCLLKYSDGQLKTPLSKVRLGYIATSGDDENGSGVKNIYRVIKDCASYAKGPKPCFLYFGQSGDPKEFQTDPANAEKAAAFGRSL